MFATGNCAAFSCGFVGSTWALCGIWHRQSPPLHCSSEINSSLGPQISNAFPVFHAFAGCDTISCFGGRERKQLTRSGNCIQKSQRAFLLLASSPTTVSNTCMQHLERVVVLLYDRTSSNITVNEARKQTFEQKGWALEAIPPSRAALNTPSMLLTRLVTTRDKR